MEYFVLYQSFYIVAAVNMDEIDMFFLSSSLFRTVLLSIPLPFGGITIILMILYWGYFLLKCFSKYLISDYLYNKSVDTHIYRPKFTLDIALGTPLHWQHDWGDFQWDSWLSLLNIYIYPCVLKKIQFMFWFFQIMPFYFCNYALKYCD